MLSDAAPGRLSGDSRGANIVGAEAWNRFSKLSPFRGPDEGPAVFPGEFPDYLLPGDAFSAQRYGGIR